MELVGGDGVVGVVCWTQIGASWWGKEGLYIFWWGAWGRLVRRTAAEDAHSRTGVGNLDGMKMSEDGPVGSGDM